MFILFFYKIGVLNEKRCKEITLKEFNGFFN